jgi:hypothetical protein
MLCYLTKQALACVLTLAKNASKKLHTWSWLIAVPVITMPVYFPELLLFNEGCFSERLHHFFAEARHSG